MQNPGRVFIVNRRERAVALAAVAAGVMAVLVALLIGLDGGSRNAGESASPGEGPRAQRAAISSGADRAALEHVLIAAGAAIEGIVLDGDGEPVPGATVVLDRHAAATADEVGRFRFLELGPGAYALHAHSATAAAGGEVVKQTTGNAFYGCHLWLVG